MPTIKRKVEMNLPQLIEWGFKNDVTNTWYRASNVEEYISEVFFDATGLPQFSNTVNKNDTFTVEIEEEITEDTKLFLISRCIGEFGNVIYLYDRTTINSRLKNLPKDCKITHLYIENEDNELQLIWTKEKGLVD